MKKYEFTGEISAITAITVTTDNVSSNFNIIFPFLFSV